MPKAIYHGEEARAKVLAGAKTLYDAVRVTMSPRGRNVAIKRPYGHTVTHDGVTVAESIVLPDVTEAIGADIIREAAGKLNNTVGDGTTSVTVLTYHLLKEADKLVKEGHNPMDIRDFLERQLKMVLGWLDDYVVELDDKKLVDVACISAGSKELGEIIGKLAIKVKDGTITVEQGSGFETETEVVDGYVMERGYTSPHFINDKRKMEVVMDNPLFIITNEKLTNAVQVKNLIEPLDLNAIKGLVIVAEEVSGEALSMIVQNHIRGILPMAVIKSPGYGDGRLPALEDLISLVGGELYSSHTIVKLGKARKVIIGKDKTTIIGGSNDTSTRIEELEAQIKDTEGEFDKERIRSRIANLKGTVGIIRVGGSTEAEIDEKKYRVDDAVAAVKAAQDGGVVAGGGVTLANLATNYPTDTPLSNMVYQALLAPFCVIADNAGIRSNDLLNQVLTLKGIGVDVTRPGALVDMVDEGIIDPAKVTREVLKTAFSLAMTAITIDTLIVDVPDET